MWLYAFFPHIYLETWFSHIPEQHAIVLYSEKQNQVIDCNATARFKGIDHGMNLHTALCLAPEAHIVSYQPHYAHKAIQQVLTRTQQYSSWLHVDQLNGLYLEVGSMNKLLGAPQHIAKQLTHDLKPLTSITSSAPYPRAARLLAHSKIEAHVTKENLRTFLDSIPIEDLAFDASLLVQMKKLGIRTLGKLLALRPSDVAYRISPDLAKEMDYLCGYRTWLPKPEQTKLLFSHQIELQFEASLSHQLLFPLSKIMREFCDFMKEHCVISDKFIIRCHHRERPASRFLLSLATPSQSHDDWLYALRHKLDNIHFEAPVTDIHTSSQSFISLDVSITNLFQPTTQHSNDAHKKLLNRLTSRLGAEQYGYLQIQANPKPERQTLTHTHLSHNSVSLKNQECLQTISSKIPVWLLKDPILITHKDYKILHGPERLEGGWWQPHPCQRDYYIALHKHSALHWLYKDISNQWFLQGFFS